MKKRVCYLKGKKEQTLFSLILFKIIIFPLTYVNDKVF